MAALIDAWPALPEVIQAGILAMVRAGRRVAAVCFYLKTQAKERGYVERSEVQHGSETRQRVIEEVIDAADDGKRMSDCTGHGGHAAEMTRGGRSWRSQ